MNTTSVVFAAFIGVTVVLCLLTFYEVIDFNGTVTSSQAAIARVFPIKAVLSANYEIDLNSIFSSKIFGEKGSGKMPECVPFHDQMNEDAVKSTKKNKEWAKRDPIVLLAAFEYEEHLSVTIQNNGLVASEVYCHYLDKDFKQLGPPTPGFVYPLYVASCCKQEGAAFISISQNPYDTAVHFVPITKRLDKEPKYTLSVCLCPIYGNTSSWLMLTELIEHYKMQGVDHFYVYVKDMDAYSRKLLHSYISSGEVETVFLSDHVSRDGEDWQHVGINDCVTRSRRHSKYVISQDLDERISPVKNGTLKDYVQEYFTSNPKVGIISFRMRWILRDQIPPSTYEVSGDGTATSETNQGNKTLQQHLPTLVYHNTSAPAPRGHTAKNILDPLKVLAMWTHYAHTMYPGYRGEYVSPDIFEIRHYRDVILSNWGKRWMPETLNFGNYTATNYPERLFTQLYTNVKKRLDEVYGS